jgi:4-amino-4-deoxy-L-arabinose transferase-like glycosyltransferase
MNSRVSLLSVVVVAALSCLVLLPSLGARYLWQDEAACAILARRLTETGKPRGWDGKNLVTMDILAPGEERALVQNAGDAEAAVRYFTKRGDFKSDTTWIGQPWGQFVVAGGAMALLGEGAWQGRLPFALLAVLTVVLLFCHLKRIHGDPVVPWVAAGLLLTNVFWILHARQCRYYALSSLLLLVTVMAYGRWREREKAGAALFVITALLFFHSDFGTFVPVLAVLGVHALVSGKGRRKEAAIVLGILGALVLPGALYYELAGRLKPAFATLAEKLLVTTGNVDRFQIPLLVLLVVVFALRRLKGPFRTEVALALVIVPVTVLWTAVVTPYFFYRYVVSLTPLSAMLGAVAVAGMLPRGLAGRARGALALGCTAFLALSPALSAPVQALLPTSARAREVGLLLRSELASLAHELRGDLPDPNREVVEFLRKRLIEGDEVLVDYEDLPVVFHTQARVRGGMGCFRVLERTPPRFAVIRRSVGFVVKEAFAAAMKPYVFTEHVLQAPDIPWGNNPDPRFHYTVLESAGELRVFERKVE